ncbi:hypothetical protein ACH5RR_004075 [Cinchona calisaya]|uniref:Uncharacterized protein n=1 Tax=Cinchona calisaya TaxID=153742 RepID=A0ABD3AWN0_9GENT
MSFLLHTKLKHLSLSLSTKQIPRLLLGILQKDGAATKLFSSQTSTISSSDARKQEKALLVKTLFKNYGFSETHISKFSRVAPLLFAVDPDKILLPKIEFLRTIGVPDADLPKILTTHSVLLSSSLTKKLIPNYNFLKDLLLSDELALKSFHRCPRILSCDVKRVVSPNIQLLKEIGVPQRFLAYLVRISPDSVFRDHHKFKGSVDEAIKMGFNAKKLTFVLAVRVFCKKPQRIRDQKIEVYRRFGLSDEDIWALFRLRPTCMDHSEKKIVGIMNFLVNEMKLPPSVVVHCPAVFTLDLEKRVIPRCRVIQLLIDKNLIKKEFSLGSVLLPAEDNFLNKFVINYENELPELMKIYKG